MRKPLGVVRQDVVRDVCLPTVAMMDSESSRHASPSCIITRVGFLFLSLLGALRYALRTRAALAIENLALR